jgi:hypothetical protein
MKWLDKVSFPILIVASLTLGLAPFMPEFKPHLLEKLNMLFDGTLKKPIDIFDLFMHGTPWVLLGLKTVRHFISNGEQKSD